MITEIKRFLWVFYTATKRFFNENYTYHASALTYTVLLAMVPLMAAIVYVSSFFPIFSRLIDNARNYIWDNIVPGSVGSIENYFQNFVMQATQLPLIGILFLFLTAIMMVNTIEESLNEAWHINKRRKWVRAFFFYSLSILLTPIILGLIVFLTTYVLTFSFFGYGRYVNLLMTSILPFLINTLIFTIVYILIPNTKVFWKDALFGGIAAGILFELIRLFFGLYIKQFSSYELIYGAFASIPIFLIWLYLFWSIILWGALVTHSAAQSRLNSKVD